MTVYIHYKKDLFTFLNTEKIYGLKIIWLLCKKVIVRSNKVCDYFVKIIGLYWKNTTIKKFENFGQKILESK